MLEVKFGDHCFSSSILATVFSLHFFPLFYLNYTSENQELFLGCTISQNQSNKAFQKLLFHCSLSIPILCQCSLSIPPEIIRKSKASWCFQGL